MTVWSIDNLVDSAQTGVLVRCSAYGVLWVSCDAVIAGCVEGGRVSDAASKARAKVRRGIVATEERYKERKRHQLKPGDLFAKLRQVHIRKAFM